MNSGILNEIIKNLPLGKPELNNNTLEIVISEEEFKNELLKNLDEKYKSYLNVEIKEGKIIIKIKLF